jgi:hypothetical protein
VRSEERLIGPLGRPSTASAADEKTCHPIVEELISKQVSDMRLRGKPRGDAEALVLRFQNGRSYLHVVDAIYPPGEQQFEPPPAEATTYRKGGRLAVLRSLMARN